MELMKLTARQAAILQYIHAHIAEHMYAPSLREIGEEVGLASTSSVKYQIDLLTSHGYLARDSRSARTMRVTSLGMSYVRSKDSTQSQQNAKNARSDSPFTSTDLPAAERIYMNVEGEVAPDLSVTVPVLGDIAAGSPIYADQVVDEVFTLPKRLTGEGELFALHVRGDSMVEAAICDGDWVIVRKQETATNGEIVAALLEGEATVKVLHKENGHITLLPCNSLYDPIPADGVEIMGKVVAVIRSIR